MNFFYFLSVISSRFLNLVSVVALSYLLSPALFGKYSLFTTNSLLIHLLCTSWITSSIWRDVSKSSPGDDHHFVAAAVKYAMLAGLCYVPVAALGAIFFNDQAGFIAVTLGQALLILLIELALVVLNGRGAARGYSLLSFMRGAFGIVIAVGLIAAGFGLWGAIAGQMLAIMLALGAFGSVRAMANGAWRAPVVWAEVSAKFRFGLVSTCALNLYMLANALGRNFIAGQLGPAQAGYFSLSADLFFAPIALFVTSLSLSSIPQLYSSHTDPQEVRDQSTVDFVMANLALALPYALGGALLAPHLAVAVLNRGTGAAVAAIAGHGAIQGACFGFLSALTTLALTRERTWLAFALSMAIIAAVVVAMVAMVSINTLAGYSSAVTWVLVAASLASIVGFRRMFGVALPAGELLKISAAAMAMAGAVALVTRHSSSIFVVAIAIAGGGALYLGLSRLLNCHAIDQLLRLKPASHSGETQCH